MNEQIAEFYQQRFVLASPSESDYQQFVGLLWQGFGEKVYLAAFCKLRGRPGAQELAQDITQDTFVKAVAWLRDRRGAAADKPINFRAWLQTIARNGAIDLMRRKTETALPTTTGEGEEQTLDVADPLGASPFDNLMQAESLEGLKLCLDGLAQRDRQLIVLYHLEDKTYAEMAEDVGIAAGDIGVPLFRARKRLRDCLEKRLASETGTVSG